MLLAGCDGTEAADTDPSSGDTRHDDPVWDGDYPEAAWTRACWTVAVGMVDSEILAFDLDSGATCVEQAFSGVDTTDTSNLVRERGEWVMATYDRVVRVRADGSSESVLPLEEYAGPIVAWDGGIAELSPGAGELRWHPTVDDLFDRSEERVSTMWPGESRLTASTEGIYGAWHSTDTIYYFGGGPGWTFGQIALTSWNGWVWGMGFVDGALILQDGTLGTTELGAPTPRGRAACAVE